MIVFYNQEDVTAGLGSGSILKEGVALILLDNNTLSTVFSSGRVTHAVYVTLIPGVEYLAYALNLDNSLTLTTGGLLGLRNGNISDDFTYPDGSSIPSDASDQMIHEWGQSCTCLLFLKILCSVISLHVCLQGKSLLRKACFSMWLVRAPATTVTPPLSQASRATL